MDKKIVLITFGILIAFNLSYTNKASCQQAKQPIETDSVVADTIVELDQMSPYWYDKEQRTIIRKNTDGQIEPKGQGTFVFKLSVSKKTGNGNITLQIQPVYQKDYEIIPYVHDGRERYSFGAGEPDANEIAINRFLDEYIYKPYYKRDNIIGVELNFNKEFYVPEKLEKVEMIIEEIENLNSKLRELENLV